MILYKNVTIKNKSKIKRNLTKSCIQNCKFVRVLDKYATVLLGLKESNLPKTSMIYQAPYSLLFPVLHVNF